jgi:hypothetical protein
MQGMNRWKIPSWLLWVLGGALYGVAMRALFGVLSTSLKGPMSLAFLIGTPIAVGALTIHAARSKNPSVWVMAFLPWVSILLMLIGCAVTMMEGAICLFLLAPLFLLFASFGGLMMGLALKVREDRSSSLKAVALLPLLIALGDRGMPLPDRHLEIRQSVLVHASPHVVWQQILTARDIRPAELPLSITHLIGVPRPVEGVNRMTPEGEVRFSRWERGVNFQGVVTNRKEDASITWHYRFDAHSFPKGSMDEHVAIGGRYFDLDDTTFNLEPMPGGMTRLEIVAHYRVSSAINFYAVPAADFLGRDFVSTILGLYKSRSERAEGAKAVANLETR